jgi:hypothetical protein
MISGKESDVDLNLFRSIKWGSISITKYMKGCSMPSDRRRILELALESLENKKKQLDAEIAEITHELRGKAVKGKSVSPQSTDIGSTRTRSRFSKEERIRRSQRMKAYWDNWRKRKSRKK